MAEIFSEVKTVNKFVFSNTVLKYRNMRVSLLCVAIISVFVSSYGQTCGIEGWRDYETHSLSDDIMENDLLFLEKESFNVAFVTMLRGFIKTRLTTNSSGQWIAFYLQSGVANQLDLQREDDFPFVPVLRCIDGSSGPSFNYNLVDFIDSNNRAPMFSANSYTFRVSLPWPSQIPITQGNLIIVQDLDYSRENAQVNVTVGRPDMLRVEMSSLGPTDTSYDFKVDLYNLNLFPGNYSFSLEANDGVHNTVVPINLIVTEPTCRAHLRDPVFGKNDKEIQTVYQTTLVGHEKVGDVLKLLNDVTKIEAYDPDELCIIDLTLDVDFLAINKDGHLVVSRILKENEIDTLKPFKLAEITATERGSGRMQRVPLIITIAPKTL